MPAGRPTARPTQDTGATPAPIPRRAGGGGNPYVDLPLLRPVRQSITTGLAKQIFAATGLLTEADAARFREPSSTTSAVSDIIVLAALLLLVAVILSSTTFQFRAVLFVTVAAIGKSVEAVWLCHLWQFAVASLFFSILLPHTHRTRTAVHQRGAMEIAGQANRQFPGAQRGKSLPRTVEAMTQTFDLQQDESDPRVLVPPSSVVTAPSRGVKFHAGPRCPGLNGAADLKVYSPCRLCFK